MPYLTLDGLIQRFGEREIERRAPDGQGGIDAEVVNRAIADAAGEIDTRLIAAGYSLPLTPVPAVIESAAADIARYRLYDDQAPDQVNRRYDAALKLLRGLATGETRLGIERNDPETAGGVQFAPGRQVWPGGGF